MSDAEDHNERQRQRLWGAAVLIALAVIVLPFLLDGAGSESQFRRVEQLREEPPRIIAADGTRSVREFRRTPDPEEPADIDALTGKADGQGDSTLEALVRAISGRDGKEAEGDRPQATATQGSDERAHGAWVVQAGSYTDAANARAVRDRLRIAGYPTFINEVVDEQGNFQRVQVGPMVDRGRAETVRREVVELLGRDAVVVDYP